MVTKITLSLVLALSVFNGQVSANEIAAAASQENCLLGKDIVLTNGKFVQMNSDTNSGTTLASAIRIRDKRIVAINELGPIDDCVTTIDLKGHTVIPGLIDSHLHFIRQAIAPGYDTREAESATTIKEFLDVLKSKADTVPDRQFVTVLGGISTAQLQEHRMPDLAELDRAVPDTPLYIQLGFAGPAYTNSIGKEHFKKLGVVVNSNGVFAAGAKTSEAFAALQSTQTLADKIRGTKDLMTYANSLGLTMAFDEGGTGFPGASHFNPRKDYQALMALSRQGQATMRVRIQHTSTAKTAERDVYDEKIENTFPQFGNSMIKFSGTGEHIVSFPTKGLVNPIYGEKVKTTAELGWSHEQHSVSDAENRQHIAMIASANTSHSIDKLRWSLSHVFELGLPGTEGVLKDLKSMKMGLRVQNHGYVNKTDQFPLGRTLGGKNAGPLYRTLYDTGIPMGAGTDGSLLGPMNPWFSIYYMVTGKNNLGKLVNPNQTLTRLEALQLYTSGSAWFSFDEDELGSIEVGKLADLVVLSKDYLSVPEQEIRSIKSLLTLVNGKIVYRDVNVDLAK